MQPRNCWGRELCNTLANSVRRIQLTVISEHILSAKNPASSLLSGEEKQKTDINSMHGSINCVNK